MQQHRRMGRLGSSQLDQKSRCKGLAQSAHMCLRALPCRADRCITSAHAGVNPACDEGLIRLTNSCCCSMARMQPNETAAAAAADGLEGSHTTGPGTQLSPEEQQERETMFQVCSHPCCAAGLHTAANLVSVDWQCSWLSYKDCQDSIQQPKHVLSRSRRCVGMPEGWLCNSGFQANGFDMTWLVPERCVGGCKRTSQC